MSAIQQQVFPWFDGYETNPDNGFQIEPPFREGEAPPVVVSFECDSFCKLR